ncbi:MAG: hypothetical protein V1792_02365 [Pseudomonadota bacterium]
MSRTPKRTFTMEINHFKRPFLGRRRSIFLDLPGPFGIMDDLLH